VLATHISPFQPAQNALTRTEIRSRICTGRQKSSLYAIRRLARARHDLWHSFLRAGTTRRARGSLNGERRCVDFHYLSLSRGMNLRFYSPPFLGRMCHERGLNLRGNNLVFVRLVRSFFVFSPLQRWLTSHTRRTIIFLVIYLVVGTLYNHFVLGLSGSDIFPRFSLAGMIYHGREAWGMAGEWWASGRGTYPIWFYSMLLTPLSPFPTFLLPNCTSSQAVASTLARARAGLWASAVLAASPAPTERESLLSAADASDPSAVQMRMGAPRTRIRSSARGHPYARSSRSRRRTPRATKRRLWHRPRRGRCPCLHLECQRRCPRRAQARPRRD
jgi:hypothetical protein